MIEVQRAWEKPKPNTTLPTPNPAARTNLIYTGVGRQAIMARLDKIRLDSVMFDGLPLSEVLRNLSDMVRARDPEKRGVNFLINPNGDTSAPTAAPVTGGFGAPGHLPVLVVQRGWIRPPACRWRAARGAQRRRRWWI